jgi:hypothetical protein
MLQILVELGSRITTKLENNLNSWVHGLSGRLLASPFRRWPKAKALALLHIGPFKAQGQP